MIRLDDGTGWAAPDDPCDVQHTLRYGSDAEVLRVKFIAASIISSYEALFFSTGKRRTEVIRKLKAVMKSEPRKERS